MATRFTRGNSSSTVSPTLLDGLRRAMVPQDEAPWRDDRLLRSLASARLVLIGEASHGTHEFYDIRAQLTRRLIEEHGFHGVVIEGDWPDAWHVNRYVQGRSDDTDAGQALGGFRRFPTWMWRNTVVREFVEWLRAHNDALPMPRRCGFYGMDLYSMHASISEVLAYLERTDAAAAARARARYSCFEHFGQDPQAYGYAASFGGRLHCEDEVIQQLRDLSVRLNEVRGTGVERDEAFYAQQNARLVQNAEEYYRTMFSGRVSSWNLRDRHMVETLQALEKHLAGTLGAPPKLVVWAHNSHLGDASATEMGDSGEWNVGQLARERWPGETVLVGFSTHRGTVTAAAEWDAPGERRHVRVGLPGSFEDVFHQVGEPRFWLPLREDRSLAQLLSQRRLQRAIGVIYAPHTERMSHYFHTHLPSQFDVMIHLDETRALQPLEPHTAWQAGEEPPETYPSGF